MTLRVYLFNCICELLWVLFYIECWLKVLVELESGSVVLCMVGIF